MGIALYPKILDPQHSFAPLSPLVGWKLDSVDCAFGNLFCRCYSPDTEFGDVALKVGGGHDELKMPANGGQKLTRGLSHASEEACRFGTRNSEKVMSVTNQRTPVRIHIVGKKNSGKTTLVCELTAELNGRGLRVATVKHTHHHHELDTPGKDSHKHREAGAVAVGILSPRMTAVFVPTDGSETGDGRYARFETQFADCDLILVEGDLQSTATRLEVWRSVVSEQPYAATDRAIVAVISDDGASLCDGESGVQVPVWPRSRVAEIADRILTIAAIDTRSV